MYLGLEKEDCNIRTREMLIFLTPKQFRNFRVFLASISAIISPNTIKTFLFFIGLYSSKFLKTTSIN